MSLALCYPPYRWVTKMCRVADLKLLVLTSSLLASIAYGSGHFAGAEIGQQIEDSTRLSTTGTASGLTPANIQAPKTQYSPQPARPGGVDSYDPNGLPAGYLCFTERQLWVQMVPCPATYISEFNRKPAPVRQRPLSRNTLCQYVAADIGVGQVWTVSHPLHERNRLLKKFSCGG